MELNKVIIVYFSRPDYNYGVAERQTIGNTKIVAQAIKELVQCDEFELLPKVSYPVGYDECVERGRKEFKGNARPELQSESLPDLSQYSTIFFGFPIWCSTYPMIFNTFFEKLPADTFKGKRIIPFCTHEGSRFGGSLADLESRTKGGKLEHGLAIQGQYSKKAKAQLVPWLKKLGFNVKE